jgi:hypothetical protein
VPGQLSAGELVNRAERLGIPLDETEMAAALARLGGAVRYSR